jgi:hypothetical protein
MRRLATVTLLVCGIAACNDSLAPAAPHLRTPGTQSVDYGPVLASLGIATASWFVNGDHIVVGGDIAISRSRLDSVRLASVTTSAPMEAEQRLHPVGFLFPQAVSDITVNLSQLTPYPIVANAVRQAMNSLSNDFGLSLRLREVSSGAKITVLPGFLGDPQSTPCGNGTTLYGCGDWPDSRLAPGDSMWMVVNNPGNNAEFAVAVAKHEFMHNLGILHTDDWRFGSIITGTPTTDPLSIMNSSASEIGPDLSFYDRVAMRRGYIDVGPAPTLTSNGDLHTLTWAPQLDALSYRVFYVTTTTNWICGAFGCTQQDVINPQHVATVTSPYFVDSRQHWGCFSFFGPPPGWAIVVEYPGGLSSPMLTARGPVTC